MGGLQLIEDLQRTRASLRDEAGKTTGIIGTSTGGPSWAQTASELQGLGRASCLCVLWDLLLDKLLVWELFMDQLFPLQTISMTVTHSHAQMRPEPPRSRHRSQTAGTRKLPRSRWTHRGGANNVHLLLLNNKADWMPPPQNKQEPCPSFWPCFLTETCFFSAQRHEGE